VVVQVDGAKTSSHRHLIEGAVMSKTEPCVIHAAPVGQGNFKWSWSTSSGRESRRFFRYFYECVAHAHANGCYVDLASVVKNLKGVQASNWDGLGQDLPPQPSDPPKSKL